MEIPAWIFFSFWALVGVGSLFLGIEALDKTDLSNSVSPVVIFFFKHSLALSACHSSTYALVFRTKLKVSVEMYYIWVSFAALPIVFSRIVGESYAWYFPVYSSINLFGLLFYFLPQMRSCFIEGTLFYFVLALYPLIYYRSRGDPFGWYFMIYFSNSVAMLQMAVAAVSEEQNGLLVHGAAVSSIFLIGGKTKYFPVLVLFIAFFTCAAWGAISGDERFQKWLPPAAVRENRILLRLKKMMENNGKVIEFAIGMAGTILFQNYFRLTSFDHVVAFLYFAVAWLSNLALLMSSQDLGIFNFFLSNAIVGCTVSQFGLRGYTWLAYGASVLLYILRQKLNSLSLVERGEDEAAVVVWKDRIELL